MKILMFGRGVIAAIYGRILEQAGHEIEFYVRPGRAATYGQVINFDLLDLRRSIWGRRVVQPWPVHLRETLDAGHDFDLIVLSVPHFRLAEAVTFLAPRVGKATILIFGNLWTEPQTAVEELPTGQVAWGFPQAGGKFSQGGVLRGSLLPSVIFGTFGKPPNERERTVREVFRGAGFRPQEQSDFRGWLWLHFVFNAGVHLQGLKLGSLAKLIGRTDALREALLVSRELLPLLEARGVDLRRHRGGVLPFRAPIWLTAPALSWVLAHIPSLRANLEVNSDPEAQESREICQDILTEARRLKVSVPRLEAAEPAFAPKSGP